MSFEDTFTRWLRDSLNTPVPAEVRSFSFNLFEGTADARFGIELIGASEFDEDDPDWPCYEAWEPQQRQLAIPEDYSGLSWEECLEAMRALVMGLIEANHPSIDDLLRSEGIGMGFVDGGIEILWKAHR